MLAILSGFGEELFFRGVFNGLLSSTVGLLPAALLSSFLFAYVHFIGQVKRFGGLLPLYTLVGLYLWLIHLYHGSLLMVMITHGVYNFVVMVSLGTQLRKAAAAPY
jgi:membrane protease YdiL (CAAX protease family)